MLSSGAAGNAPPAPSSTVSANLPHRTRLTVRFGDIDLAGIVYYPRFLHFCHVAMEEFVRDVLGIPYPDLLQRDRVGFPAVRAEVDFRHPLRYGDVVEIETAVERVGSTSVAWRYAMRRHADGEPIATCRTVTVCVDMDGFAKQPVPAWLRERLEAAARDAAPPPAGTLV